MSKTEETNLPYEGKITGFDLLPKGQGAVVNYTDNPIENGEPTYKELIEKVHRRPSENLTTILRALIGHAIYYCGWSYGKLTEKELKSRKVVDMPEFESYQFKGFSIKGDGEEEKIIVKMTKVCAGDEVISIVTPPIPIAAGEYVYDDVLASDLQNVIEQIQLFISGKNYFVQAAIEFPQPVEESEEDEL